MSKSRGRASLRQGVVEKIRNCNGQLYPTVAYIATSNRRTHIRKSALQNNAFYIMAADDNDLGEELLHLQEQIIDREIAFEILREEAQR